MRQKYTVKLNSSYFGPHIQKQYVFIIGRTQILAKNISVNAAGGLKFALLVIGNCKILLNPLRSSYLS